MTRKASDSSTTNNRRRRIPATRSHRNHQVSFLVLNILACNRATVNTRDTILIAVEPGIGLRANFHSLSNVQGPLISVIIVHTKQA